MENWLIIIISSISVVFSTFISNVIYKIFIWKYNNPKIYGHLSAKDRPFQPEELTKRRYKLDDVTFTGEWLCSDKFNNMELNNNHKKYNKLNFNLKVAIFEYHNKYFLFVPVLVKQRIVEKTKYDKYKVYREYQELNTLKNNNKFCKSTKKHKKHPKRLIELINEKFDFLYL